MLHRIPLKEHSSSAYKWALGDGIIVAQLELLGECVVPVDELKKTRGVPGYLAVVYRLKKVGERYVLWRYEGIDLSTLLKQERKEEEIMEISSGPLHDVPDTLEECIKRVKRQASLRNLDISTGDLKVIRDRYLKNYFEENAELNPLWDAYEAIDTFQREYH